MSYLDQESGERFIPYVIEPAAGVDRGALVFLLDAYAEDEAPDAKGNLEKRTVLRLDRRLAPVKVAVLPLSRNADLSPKARDLAAAAAQALEHRLRRRQRDRPPVPAAGRDRHPVLRHRRLRHAGRPGGHGPRPRLHAPGARRPRQRRGLPDGAPRLLLTRTGPPAARAARRGRRPGRGRRRTGGRSPPRPGESRRAGRPRPWSRRSPPSRPPTASPWPPRTRRPGPAAAPGRAGTCPTRPAGLPRRRRRGPPPAPPAAAPSCPWSTTRRPSSAPTPRPDPRRARARPPRCPRTAAGPPRRARPDRYSLMNPGVTGGVPMIPPST